jgi:predicted HicB family RNase H-like nuclease
MGIGEKNFRYPLDKTVALNTIDTKNTERGDSMATVNLRDFPEQLHREAKAKAALMGISLKDLVVKAVERFLETEKKQSKKGK